MDEQRDYETKLLLGPLLVGINRYLYTGEILLIKF